ncbi:MAG: 4-hydroxy-tetrahydrodipicolinate reductase [Candidatus Omnitrophica bacterium]|nr:4-hydroxy-tetrahydrodipicolinate reductase [Candidatus Omnitrophota bacterium]
MVRIAMNGALGKMGQRILHLAARSKDCRIAGAYDRPDAPGAGRDIGEIIGLGSKVGVPLTALGVEALRHTDVLIDFSSAQGVEAALRACVQARKAIVIGTTGLEKPAISRIKAAALKIPVVFSPNMSVGANFLFELAALAAAKLGAGYDIEVVEAHHRHKKDAPSGTARRLAESIAEAKGWDLDRVAKYGRQGITGERPHEQIGIHVIRAGEIVGDHTAIFSGPGETIEIVHRAHTRDAFARGALVAALYVSGKKKGYYTMKDVLR